MDLLHWAERGSGEAAGPQGEPQPLICPHTTWLWGGTEAGVGAGGQDGIPWHSDWGLLAFCSLAKPGSVDGENIFLKSVISLFTIVRPGTEGVIAGRRVRLLKGLWPPTQGTRGQTEPGGSHASS